MSQLRTVNLDTMNEFDALDVLDHVASRVPMDRDSHNGVMRAKAMLEAFILKHAGPRPEVQPETPANVRQMKDKKK